MPLQRSSTITPPPPDPNGSLDNCNSRAKQKQAVCPAHVTFSHLLYIPRTKLAHRITTSLPTLLHETLVHEPTGASGRLRGSSYPSTTAVVCRYAPAQYTSNTQGTGIIGKRGVIRVESVSIQTIVMLTRVCVVHVFPLHSKTLSLVTAQQPGLLFVWSMPQLSNLLFFGIFFLLES